MWTSTVVIDSETNFGKKKYAIIPQKFELVRYVYIIDVTVLLSNFYTTLMTMILCFVLFNSTVQTDAPIIYFILFHFILSFRFQLE